MKGENAYAFPFHYGQEAESYTFYRVPKILFTAEAFDHLSTDAKLLYGILLDRMQLSIKNNWIDEDGKVFIYYPRQNIMDTLTCGNKKAGQLLAELDERNGIGLITRIHQGLGKPDKIYVHKCIVPDMKVRGNPGPVRVEWAVFDAHFMRSPFHFQFRVTGASVPASGKEYEKQNLWIGQQAWSASFIGSGKEYKRQNLWMLGSGRLAQLVNDYGLTI